MSYWDPLRSSSSHYRPYSSDWTTTVRTESAHQARLTRGLPCWGPSNRYSNADCRCLSATQVQAQHGDLVAGEILSNLGVIAPEPLDTELDIVASYGQDDEPMSSWGPTPATTSAESEIDEPVKPDAKVKADKSEDGKAEASPAIEVEEEQLAPEDSAEPFELSDMLEQSRILGQQIELLQHESTTSSFDIRDQKDQLHLLVSEQKGAWSARSSTATDMDKLVAALKCKEAKEKLIKCALEFISAVDDGGRWDSTIKVQLARLAQTVGMKTVDCLKGTEKQQAAEKTQTRDRKTDPTVSKEEKKKSGAAELLLDPDTKPDEPKTVKSRPISVFPSDFSELGQDAAPEEIDDGWGPPPKDVDVSWSSRRNDTSHYDWGSFPQDVDDSWLSRRNDTSHYESTFGVDDVTSKKHKKGTAKEKEKRKVKGKGKEKAKDNEKDKENDKQKQKACTTPSAVVADTDSKVH